MRVVIQRVSAASVEIEGIIKREIGEGLMVLLGIHVDDTEKEVTFLSEKLARLRIFEDEEGVMNKSLLDVGGDVLLVSQFTLYASTKKGNRPSYFQAARPIVAIPLYEQFIQSMEALLGKRIYTGEFGAYMSVSLTNEGPTTIVMDSRHEL